MSEVESVVMIIATPSTYSLANTRERPSTRCIHTAALPARAGCQSKNPLAGMRHRLLSNANLNGGLSISVSERVLNSSRDAGPHPPAVGMPQRII